MKKLRLKKWVKETIDITIGSILVALFLITLMNCYLYAYNRNGSHQENYYYNVSNR